LRARRPPARIGARVNPPRRDDPIAAFNQVLSEVIDTVLDVKQAHRRVPETHALHAVLDQLFADLRIWAWLLADQEQALGVSPLASMPSAADRTPPTPWHGAASDEEVRRIVGEHLDRLDNTRPQHSQNNPMRRYERPSPRWSKESWPTGGRSARSNADFRAAHPALLSDRARRVHSGQPLRTDRSRQLRRAISLPWRADRFWTPSSVAAGRARFQPRSCFASPFARSLLLAVSSAWTSQLDKTSQLDNECGMGARTAKSPPAPPGG
jgi:DNA-binding ferritin-like protein